MSNEAQSSVYLRNMIRRFVSSSPGSGQDLQNINTQNLPDGAFCYVTETKQRFRFRKFATDAAVSNTIIIPSSGTGRWFLEGGPTGSLPLFVRATAANNAPTGTGAIWVASDDSNFELVLGPGSFTMNPAGCLLTYFGPQCIYLVRAIATLTFPTPDVLFLGVSFEGDLSGTDAGFTEGAEFTDTSLDNEGSESFNMVSERIVVINAGEVIQPVFRLVGGGNATTIERFTLSATPIA